MVLDTSIPFRALQGMYNPADTAQQAMSLRSLAQQHQLRGLEMQGLERQLRAAQRQAENEKQVDAIRLGGGTLSATYLGGGGAGVGQPAAVAGALGQDGPQSTPVKSLREMAGLSVPGYAGGQYSVGGGRPARTGQVNRYGGRSRQQIYDQIAQQVGPRQADAWLQQEMSFDKGFAETSKEQAGAEEAWGKVDTQKLQNAVAETQRAASLMAYVDSQEALDRVRAQLTAEGNDDVDGIPEVYQPGMQQQWVQRAMGVVKSAELELEKRKAAETERANRNRERLTVRGQDITVRGQDISRENSLRTASNAQGHLMETPDGPMLVDRRTGDARPVTVNGQPLPGQAAQKRAQGAGRVLGLLDQAEALIGDATSSYFGTGLDHAARFIGRSTGGSRAIAQLRALEGALLAEMPRMEGPQSDRDVQMYRQAAGHLGDPTIPAAEKRAALETIRGIQQRYAGGGSQVGFGGTGEVPDMLRDRGGAASNRAPQVQSLYDEFGLED